MLILNMAYFQINESSKIPKYMQIRSWLYGMIKRGKIKIGDRLPTEEELSKNFRVNRMTVRKAYDELVNEKMLVRKRRKGTFLIAEKPKDFIYGTRNISSFTDDMLEYGVEPVTKTMKIDVRKAPADIRELLQLPEGAMVNFILRVKLADKEPVLIERSYLSYDEFKGIVDMDLEGSLYHLLVENFDINLHHSTQIFSAEITTREDMKLLGLEEPIPCIKLESVTYDQNNIPIEVLHSVYRGDKYKFKANSGEYLFQK